MLRWSSKHILSNGGFIVVYLSKKVKHHLQNQMQDIGDDHPTFFSKESL